MYLYSQVDRDNLNWFVKDMSLASLSKMRLLEGHLRGLSPFRIKFTYPISVIIGRNRSGKSTMLAMAACAFHNREGGFKLSERKVPYYTFADFFVQTSEEMPPGGIKIGYCIMYNQWVKSKHVPDGVGDLWQERDKKNGGKWTKYESRVPRNVVYFGIQRVVPPSEKSVSKSYKAFFADQATAGWETQVKDVVGRILGTSYDTFRMKTYGKYRLSSVTTQGTSYSGFNMGAGENALFEIFSTIYATPKGTLLVIDEIELGLHEEAQKKFMQELKEVCRDRHIQVICTTHSSAVVDAVPPEARFYVECLATTTTVTPGVSSLFAAGRLSGQRSGELDIYVEDAFAKTLLEAFMDNNIRKRVKIIPIGSPAAIIHQSAARYKDQRPTECIIVMDGDQSDSHDMHINQFIKALEATTNREKDSEWFSKRLGFLPGDTWPERWLIKTLLSLDISELAKRFNVPTTELSLYIEQAKNAGEHNEFFSLATSLCLDTETTYLFTAEWVVKQKSTEFDKIGEIIRRYLP